jgi:AcrR family transcriptional regulator
VNNVNIATRRSYHHGNLRAALIEATLRAIAEDGPDGFTLRDVARRAGVSAAAPYRHFRDKEELLAAVAGECAERIGETMDQAVAATPGNALDKFRATGIAYVQFVVDHPEHFRALNIPGIVARMPEEPRKAWDAWNAEQRHALALAQAAGVIAPMSLDDLCLAANALVHGLGHLIVEGALGEVTKERATELATAVTGVLGIGLIPRGGPAVKSTAAKTTAPKPTTKRPARR